MLSISSSPAAAYQPLGTVQVGQIPVGQESGLGRLQRIRPVEQAATVARAGQDKRGASEVVRPERSPEDTQQPTTSQPNGMEASAEQDKHQQAQKQFKEKAEQNEINQLKQLAARDREVRAHEQAHKAVAGNYGGAIHYEYQRGPDGNRYAVGGEVSIDTSPESSPEATLAKARVIQRAANAPAEPSDQDRSVAAQAAQMEQQALQQMAEARLSAGKQAVKGAGQEQPVPDKAVDAARSAPAPSGISSDAPERPAHSGDRNADPNHSSKRLALYSRGSASLNFHVRV